MELRDQIAEAYELERKIEAETHRLEELRRRIELELETLQCDEFRASGGLVAHLRRRHVGRITDFLAFLESARANGTEGVVKYKICDDAANQELAFGLWQKGERDKVKLDVHHMTLSAMIKDTLKKKQPLPPGLSYHLETKLKIEKKKTKGV